MPQLSRRGLHAGCDLAQQLLSYSQVECLSLLHWCTSSKEKGALIDITKLLVNL